MRLWLELGVRATIYDITSLQTSDRSSVPYLLRDTIKLTSKNYIYIFYILQFDTESFSLFMCFLLYGWAERWRCVNRLWTCIVYSVCEWLSAFRHFRHQAIHVPTFQTHLDLLATAYSDGSCCILWVGVWFIFPRVKSQRKVVFSRLHGSRVWPPWNCCSSSPKTILVLYTRGNP